MIGLFSEIDWKIDSYISILIIVDLLIKIVYDKLIKKTFDATHFRKIIMPVILC